MREVVASGDVEEGRMKLFRCCCCGGIWGVEDVRLGDAACVRRWLARVDKLIADLIINKR